MTRASPASDFAPETTSPSRHALIAFGLTGTTGWPASSSASTSRPSGRSIPTETSARSPSLPSLRISSANPAAVWLMVNVDLTRPVSSSTHTAWVSAAQSRPTWNKAGGAARDSDTSPPQVGSDDSVRRLCAGRSLTGALGRVLLMPVYNLGRAGGGGVMLALAELPTLAVTPTLTEPEQRASSRCPQGRGCTSDHDGPAPHDRSLGPAVRVRPRCADLSDVGADVRVQPRVRTLPVEQRTTRPA